MLYYNINRPCLWYISCVLETMVTIDIAGIHRNPEIWDNPLVCQLMDR